MDGDIWIWFIYPLSVAFFPNSPDETCPGFSENGWYNSDCIYIYIYFCIRYITILVHHLMFQYMFIGFTIDDHPIIPLLMNKKHLINWTIVPCKKIEIHHEIYHESIIVISRRKLWDSIAEGTMLGWKKLYIYILLQTCMYIHIYICIYIYIHHTQSIIDTV